MNTQDFTFKNYSYEKHCKNAINKGLSIYGYCNGKAYVGMNRHFYTTPSVDLTSFELLEMVLDFESK